MKSAQRRTQETSNAKANDTKLQPTAAEALTLIESLRGEAAKYGHCDTWIGHTILVGECAGKIAAAIRETQIAHKNQIASNQPAETQPADKDPATKTQADGQTELIDPDRATAIGYLHDLGKGLGPFYDHPLTGYRYLKSHGYADEFCSVCLTHSFTNRECEMLSGYRPDDAFLQDYIATHENTLYEDIAALCDLYCNDQVLPLEGRLIDVIIRYGSSDRTAHRLDEIYKLKAKIESKMDKSVEEVLGLPHFDPLLKNAPRKTTTN